MPNRIRGIVFGVQAVLLLTACQSMRQDHAEPMKIAAVENLRHGAPQPEALLALGRYYSGQMREDKAIETYRTLATLYPDHAEGRNALGMALAKQGHYAEAIVELAKAVASAPDSARLRNNLGYAYLLQGNPTQAVAVLEAAARLDPQNQRVQENLQLALASPATEPPAAAPATTSGTVVTAPNPVAAAPAPVTPTVAASLPSQPVAAAADAAHPVSLEIANGNGITGMARNTSRQLRGAGYARMRLTNQRPYRLATTQIQYRPGFETQAHQLQAALRAGVPVIAATQLRADVHLRLALGKDVQSTHELVSQGPTPAMKLVAQSAQGD